MRLAVLERILLVGLLGAHKDRFDVLTQIREARETLSFNDIENAKLKFIQTGDQSQWNPNAALEIGEVEIELADSITKIIKETLTRLNDTSQLTDQHYTLYEKFVIEPDLH
jgi:hypothetical protein